MVTHELGGSLIQSGAAAKAHGTFHKLILYNYLLSFKVCKCKYVQKSTLYAPYSCLYLNFKPNL